MTYDEERITTRSDETRVAGGPPAGYPAAPVPPSAQPPGYDAGYGSTVTQQRVVRRASSMRTLERLVVFVFSVIQLVIALRIVLLLVNAREGNDLVSAIYDLSDPLVSPFRGIIGGTTHTGTFLDVAALVALVGWTILEVVIIGLVRVFKREP
jgi:uncharacterized protein YggT (Ycf19 family)